VSRASAGDAREVSSGGCADLLVPPPSTSRGKAPFVLIVGRVFILLSLCAATYAFDRPFSWLPMLVVMRYPFWFGIWSNAAAAATAQVTRT
jgi:hypothetical protein